MLLFSRYLEKYATRESRNSLIRKMAKNVFSKLGVFLIAISLYCYIMVFCTVSAKTA
ncbi:hypothetical protein T4D_9105 [Trichinella pseudospiralis]|uniref:Uncharacterized protein n=1 Tax=Trichinella pseudospiralis TaxID=6337 RepID=A0A0V1ETW1_TRIPS|nr:hypothetical protein T4D_9105 [Trichinella pseudospiralis]